MKRHFFPIYIYKMGLETVPDNKINCLVISKLQMHNVVLPNVVVVITIGSGRDLQGFANFN